MKEGILEEVAWELKLARERSGESSICLSPLIPTTFVAQD